MAHVVETISDGLSDESKLKHAKCVRCVCKPGKKIAFYYFDGKLHVNYPVETPKLLDVVPVGKAIGMCGSSMPQYRVNGGDNLVGCCAIDNDGKVFYGWIHESDAAHCGGLNAGSLGSAQSALVSLGSAADTATTVMPIQVSSNRPNSYQQVQLLPGEPLVFHFTIQASKKLAANYPWISGAQLNQLMRFSTLSSPRYAITKDLLNAFLNHKPWHIVTDPGKLFDGSQAAEIAAEKALYPNWVAKQKSADRQILFLTEHVQQEDNGYLPLYQTSFEKGTPFVYSELSQWSDQNNNPVNGKVDIECFSKEGGLKFSVPVKIVLDAYAAAGINPPNQLYTNKIQGLGSAQSALVNLGAGADAAATPGITDKQFSFWTFIGGTAAALLVGGAIGFLIPKHAKSPAK